MCLMWHNQLRNQDTYNFFFFVFNYNAFLKSQHFGLHFNNVSLGVKFVFLSGNTAVIQQTNLWIIGYSNSCSDSFNFKSWPRHWLEPISFPSSLNRRCQIFTNIYLLDKQPNFMLLYYFAHYITVEYFNISVGIIQSLPASHRIIPNFNFNELPYKISLTYVTFTAQWNGNAIVLGTDYDRFLIFKYCAFESNKRKYVPFEIFKCLAYLFIMCSSPISIGF